MKVRYNPVLGVLLVVVGAVCAFLGLWLLMLGEFSPGLVVGLLPILIGVLYLVRPYFWVFPMSVTVPALFGPVKRQFPFHSLEINGGRLAAIGSDGTRKKIPVARWLAHSADWNAVTDRSARLGHPDNQFRTGNS